MANDNAWRENLKSPGRKLASEASSRISKGQKEGLKKFKGYIYSVGTLGSWKGRGAKDDDDNDDDMKKNVNHGRRANDNAWKEILKSSGRKLASEVSSGISKGQEEGLKVFKGLVYSVGSLGRSKGRGAKDEDDDNDDDMKKNVNHGRKANDNAWREFLKSSGRKLTSDVSSRISKGQEEGLKRFKGFVYSVGSLGRSKGRGADDDDDSDDDMKKNVNHGRRANDNAWGEILKSSGRKFTSDVSSRISKGQEDGLKRFKGYIYSVSSLGRSKGRGADDNDDNDDDMKSQASQISALSFLSEGMRVLASKGANLFKRGPSPPDDKSASDESTEKFSSIETLMTDVKDADVGLPSISAAAGLRWRDVRMIVRGVRGECYGLAKTVRYRAARRIQVQARMQLARKAMIDRQKSARAARLWGEECRLRRRQRELNFKKRCKQIYRKEGERWRVRQTKSRQALVFDPGGSKGRLPACLFLGTWRALLCGKVSFGRWMIPEAGAGFFGRRMASEYNFPERGTNDAYILRSVAVFHTGSRQSLTARGYVSCGAEWIPGNAIDDKELHGALGGECNLKPKRSTVFSTSSTRSQPTFQHLLQVWYYGNFKGVEFRFIHWYCCTVTVVPHITSSLFSRTVLLYIRVRKVACLNPHIALLWQRVLFREGSREHAQQLFAASVGLGEGIIA